MSWYRKVDIRMEGDRRYRSLSDPQPCGKFLWHYLLTGQHTRDGLPGLYPVGRADLAARLGWKLPDFDRAWKEVSENGTDKKLPMALADWSVHVVWIPNSLHYNPPESPNVVRGWSKPFDLIPECDLRDCWAFTAAKELEAIGPKWVKAFREAFGEALPEALPEAFAKPLLNPQPQPQPQTQEDGAAVLPLEAPSADNIAIMMPVKDGEVPITKKMVGEYLLLYGNIDVMQTLKKMRGHWLAKPVSHRKTRRGIKTSINTWLAKDSDRKGGGGSARTPDRTNRTRNEQVMLDSMKGD